MAITHEDITRFCGQLEAGEQRLEHALDPIWQAIEDAEPATPEMLASVQSGINRLRDVLDMLEAHVTHAALESPAGRFQVRELGQHHAEHDRYDGSLRLSWPGAQTFLNKGEVEQLRAFLTTIARDLSR